MKRPRPFTAIEIETWDDYKSNDVKELTRAGRFQSARWQAGAMRDPARRDRAMAWIDTQEGAAQCQQYIPVKVAERNAAGGTADPV